MAVGYQRFVRSHLNDDERAELEAVDELAELVRRHLEVSAIEIDAAHVHRAGSSDIQKIASRLLKVELGFQEETRFAEDTGFITRARPDFIYRLSDGRGVLAEVERGGTTTNNHDLKDFWKTHIAPDAQHLFLIVPHANWNLAGTAREKPFARVVRRLSAFFGDARREVDVLSAHIFGYGKMS